MIFVGRMGETCDSLIMNHQSYMNSSLPVTINNPRHHLRKNPCPPLGRSCLQLHTDVYPQACLIPCHGHQHIPHESRRHGQGEGGWKLNATYLVRPTYASVSSFVIPVYLPRPVTGSLSASRQYTILTKKFPKAETQGSITNPHQRPSSYSSTADTAPASPCRAEEPCGPHLCVIPPIWA